MKTIVKKVTEQEVNQRQVKGKANLKKMWNFSHSKSLTAYLLQRAIF